MKRILFICTGNYYRSRFAEILFNELCQQEKLPFWSFSKGLRLSKNNKGPISIHTKNYMSLLNSNISYLPRMPIPVDKFDFEFYDRIIALDENEHRPMMKSRYPKYENSIEYWHFVDDYVDGPENVLPKLENHVRQFIDELKKDFSN